MFFKGHLLGIASRFLWFGLILGLFHIVCKLVILFSRRNVYVSNIVGFCFWLLFGFVFSRLSIVFNNYQVCWFGLFSMFFGFFLVKISVDFFFTKFARVVYNKLANSNKRKQKYEQLQANS